MTPTMRVRTAVAGAALALVAGCSQAAALAPVGGGALAEVRFASIDVLLRAGVTFVAAPVCRSTTADLRCEGETTQGEPILVVSPGADAATMTVTVGARELYAGSVTEVLDAAARPR